MKVFSFWRHLTAQVDPLIAQDEMSDNIGAKVDFWAEKVRQRSPTHVCQLTGWNKSKPVEEEAPGQGVCHGAHVKRGEPNLAFATNVSYVGPKSVKSCMTPGRKKETKLRLFLLSFVLFGNFCGKTDAFGNELKQS